MNCYKIAICFLLLTYSGHAQELVTLNETNITKRENGNLTITLPFEIVEGYHIQSEIESDNGSIATEIRFEENDLFELVYYEFSKKSNEKLVLNEITHDVLVDSFEVLVTLKPSESSLKSTLNGELYYQACTNKQCLFPRTLNFQILNK